MNNKIMNKTIYKDILSIKSGIVCHQVNCKGIMGKGLALDIKNKYPSVHTAYLNRCISHDSKDLLGHVLLSFIPETSLIIASLFGQENYGSDGKLYTDYKALEKCLEFLARYFSKMNVYIPYKIGCGLGGGDWKIVSKIISDILPFAVIVQKKGI